MAEYEFKVVVNHTSPEEVSCTIKCFVDVFSSNISEINSYVSSLGGSLLNSTTATVPSIDSMLAMTNKLTLLTIPIKLSKKKKKR